VQKAITYVGLDAHKDSIIVSLAEAGLRDGLREVREYGKILNAVLDAEQFQRCFCRLDRFVLRSAGARDRHRRKNRGPIPESPERGERWYPEVILLAHNSRRSWDSHFSDSGVLALLWRNLGEGIPESVVR
jgi:hypothetical protein